jgi:hypothetical protein
MPITKRILFTILVILAGAIGYLIELRSGSENLAIAMVILTVMMIVSLWALSPVNRDEDK